MRLALCQMNATVGEIAGNAQRIRAGIAAARRRVHDLVLFPELALTGYPPEDLLLREHFLQDAAAALQELAGGVGDAPWSGTPSAPTDCVYNAAAVLADGGVRSIYRKVHLPNYGVFDEQRYFVAGHTGAVIARRADRRADGLRGPVAAGRSGGEEVAAGARLILNISASPYHAGKGLERERLFAQRARENGTHIAFCALVGGQDELVFDGHSFVLDPTGATIARAAQFEEDVLVCELDLAASSPQTTTEPPSAARRRSPQRRPRSTPRCNSACATTCARTDSPRWCSASPVGLTRRWSAASPRTRSAPSG